MIGNLRVDNENNWYLIPANIVMDFDYMLAEVMNDTDADHVNECWKYLEDNFKKYRITTEEIEKLDISIKGDIRYVI